MELGKIRIACCFGKEQLTDAKV
jgi:hypothetical protein